MKDGSLFEGVEIISSYTRADAIEDGVLCLLSQDEWDEVCRQHYKYPIACTAAVFGLIEQAVNHPKWCNDFKGVIHDILWMSRKAVCRRTDDTVWFRVMITGTGRKQWHDLKMVCGPDDDGSPCLTIMLPNED